MKEEPIKIIMEDFSNLGYDVTYQLLKSDEHGIPQKEMACNNYEYFKKKKN